MTKTTHIRIYKADKKVVEQTAATLNLSTADALHKILKGALPA